MEITENYLKDEIISFREIMCSTKYTIEQKDNAFKGLFWVWLRCNSTLTAKFENLINATILEWERRKLYEVVRI